MPDLGIKMAVDDSAPSAMPGVAVTSVERAREIQKNGCFKNLIAISPQSYDSFISINGNSP